MQDLGSMTKMERYHGNCKGFKQLLYQLHTSTPIVIHYKDLKSSYENPIGKRTKQCLVLCRAQI